MANSIQLGDQTANTFYVGAEQADKLFLGSDLIWPISVGEAAPTRIASYGPNGTHYPSEDTPWVNASFDYTTTASACTWAAVRTAIEACIARPKSEKTRVLIPSGQLAGNGRGASDAAVLSSLGDLDRDWNILVMPANGRGTVTTADAGIRVATLAGLTFWGIDHGINGAGNGMTITSSERLRWCWSAGQSFNCHGSNGVFGKDVAFYECVTAESRIVNGDAWAFRERLDTIQAIGCYIAGTQRFAGDDEHTDTLQLSAAAGGGEVYHDILLQDCALWSSTNQAFQVGDAWDVVVDHTLIVAGGKQELRYPWLDGADNTKTVANDAAPNNINGGTAEVDHGATYKDSILAGGDVFRRRDDGLLVAYKSIINTRSSDNSSLPTGFTYDASLDSWTLSNFNAINPKPTTTYLSTIWSV
jgi:hypothetical protein